jgi:hypothetical protein
MAGGEVVSLTHRPRFTPYKHFSSVPGTHLYYRLTKPQGLMRLEGLGKLKNCDYLFGNRTLGLAASAYRLNYYATACPLAIKLI